MGAGGVDREVPGGGHCLRGRGVPGDGGLQPSQPGAVAAQPSWVSATIENTPINM